MGAIELSDYELDMILSALVVYQRKELDAMGEIPEGERGSLSEAFEGREWDTPVARAHHLGELIYKLQYEAMRRNVGGDAAKAEAPS